MSKSTNDWKAEAPVAAPIRVAIIDDDKSMRTSLSRLLKATGIETSVFSSAIEFLGDGNHHQMDCAVTDLRMPGLDGLSFQEEIGKRLPHLSLVFITGHGSVPDSVKAMKSGAVDFLEKPVESESLLAAIHRAAARSRTLKVSHKEVAAIELHYGELTPREREVFSLVVAGRLNKQIASDLGIAEKTVKVHRARVMEKMCADSLAGLVRMADRLGVRPLEAAKPLA